MGELAVFLGILLVGAILYFLFTDPTSFMFFGLLLGILAFVLIYFGFVTFETKPNQLDIDYNPSPVPSGSTANGIPQPSIQTPLEEVFYIANNIFTYDQAPAVCKAYGGDVATYSQVEDAYSRGAEWCGYGWTQGGIALFPTQEETWRKLQLEIDPAKRISCGRPGINGGYFDPSTKFGVNCYGVRPEKRPGAQEDLDKQFAASVDRLKGMLDKITVYPFSTEDWSEYTNVSKTIIAAVANIKGLGSQIQKNTSGLGRTASEIGEGVAEGTAMTVTGIVGIGTSLVKNVIMGVGDLGSSLLSGVGKGLSNSSPRSQENPDTTQ